MTDEQLTAIEQRRAAAKAEVIAICKGKQWRMCIPVEQTDSDICITNSLDDIDALVAEVRRLQHDVERFTLNADDEDTIENLIHRLRGTMSDGELYGVDEQIPQMRYILREAFAPLFAEVVKLRADVERIAA